MKFSFKMDKKNNSNALLKTYPINQKKSPKKSDTDNQDNVPESEPLSTKNAIEYLLDGTLRLRVCRYCLSLSTQLSELDEILEIGISGSIHEVTIKDMVASFHPVKVMEDLNFPNKICSQCVSQAMTSYLFLQKCEQSERAIRNCFDDIQEKFLGLDPLEPIKKRGKRKLNPNTNIIYVEHQNAIDYAEPIINIVNLNSIPQDTENISDLECMKCWQVLPNIQSLMNHEKSHPKTMWYHCRHCGKSFLKRNHLKKHLKNLEKAPINKCNSQNITELRCLECGFVSDNLGRHLQHTEIHKFKTLLEHLVEKKMNKLCCVCLETSSDMVRLDEVIHLHGGYPGLTGDKALYDIVCQTFPNMSIDSISGTHICSKCLDHTITSYVFTHKILHVRQRFETCVSAMLEDLLKLDNCSGTIMVEISQNIILPMFKYDSIEINNEDVDLNESDLEVDVLEDEFREPVPGVDSESEGENPAKNVTKTYSKKPLLNGYQKLEKIKDVCSEFLTFKKKVKTRHKLQCFYTCPFCNKHFVSDYFLKKHIIKHVNREVECMKCSNRFSSKFHLFEHVKMVHILKDHNSLPCKTCGRRYKNLIKLKSHEACHSFKECYLCNKHFKTQKHYDVHIQRHLLKLNTCENNDKQTCSFCEKSCANDNELSLHVNKIHLRMKPYSCDMCEKQYYTDFNLTSHKKLHSMISKETCKFCEKVFRCRKDLVIHVRKHIGIKPHQCPVCRQNFYSDAKMKHHMKKIHGGRICCRLCKTIVNSYSDLKVHINIAHSFM